MCPFYINLSIIWSATMIPFSRGQICCFQTIVKPKATLKKIPEQIMFMSIEYECSVTVPGMIQSPFIQADRNDVLAINLLLQTQSFCSLESMHICKETHTGFSLGDRD